MDALLLRIGFKGQLTNTPKPDTAPNNLFAPLPGYYDKVEGHFSAQALYTSPLSKLQMTGAVRWATSVSRGALGGLAQAGQTLWQRAAGPRGQDGGPRALQVDPGTAMVQA